MPKPSRRRLAAVVATLLAAQKAQPANADIARVVSAFNAWTSEGTLSGTVARGEELGAALTDLFGEVKDVINKAPIREDLKVAAMEEVAEVVQPTPTPSPPPPPPELDVSGRWVGKNIPGYVPSAGDVYARLDKTRMSPTRGEVPDYSMWKYMYPEADGNHRLFNTLNSKEEIVVSDADLKSKYKLFEIADWRAETMGGRKTRRGKKRRTVKRRAKSLCRRRQ